MATEPRQTPLADAGRAPVGVNQVTGWTKLRDSLIVIVIPFAIPALVLPVANGAASFTITNVAFGFVAVAVAGVARAVTQKADEWQAFALIALIAVVFETALAVVDDTAEAYSHLKTSVLQETARLQPVNLLRMREGALAIVSAEPSIFHWVLSALLGSVLITVSFILIAREK
jgi:hypothetical protein